MVIQLKYSLTKEKIIHGEFQNLCEKTLINHHTTSKNHFEVDGSTKWMVHIYGEARSV
jgi:hypothetical protein